MEITGVIESGAGKGAYFVHLDWVVRQCRTHLGYAPYPGTLNVKVRDEDLAELARFLERAGLPLVPDDPAFCAAQLRPVTVRGIPGALVLPSDEVRIHEKRIVEVIAPCNLKQALGVGDGDPIRICAAPAGGTQTPAERYRALYSFGASAGALEGFVYRRPSLEAPALRDWIRNLSAQHEELPEDVRGAIQGDLDRTLGRAVHSIAAHIGDDHPHVTALRAMMAGPGPATADDFEAEKTLKAVKYSSAPR